MNFDHRREQDTVEINLIPLIDVLLVILIFLAATTSFTRQSQLPITLPQAQAQALDAQPVIELAISAHALYMLDGRSLDASEGANLSQALQKALRAHPDAVLRIAADGQASHASVVHALEAARAAGIEHVQFLAQTLP